MWYWCGLAFFIGFGMGGLVMFELWLYELKRQYNKRNKNKQCTHGYEDWDDCPDCRH